MKRLSEEINLQGKFETISVTELRHSPGAVLEMVNLGKVFVITKAGNPVAVLSKPPGTTLSIEIDEHGKLSYQP